MKPHTTTADPSRSPRRPTRDPPRSSFPENPFTSPPTPRASPPHTADDPSSAPTKPAPVADGPSSTPRDLRPPSALSPRERMLDRISDPEAWIPTAPPRAAAPSDDEKWSHREEAEPEAPAPDHGTRDPEKSAHGPSVHRDSQRPRSSRQSGRQSKTRQTSSTSHHPHSPYSQARSHHSHSAHASSEIEPDDADDEERKDRNVWILIYLSLFSTPLTLLVAGFAVITVPLLLVSHPFYLSRLACPYVPLPTRIYNTIAPAIRFQIRRCGHHRTHAPHVSSHVPPSAPPVALASKAVMVSIASPVYAVFVAVSSCIAGAFWIFAEILRDPVRSTGGGDEDGRRAVESVRDWWVTWLGRGLR